MPLAPAMTGIARKKEYSAATGRESPISMEPRMVDPEREVPGMMESAWNSPTENACESDSSRRSVTTGVLFWLTRSMTRKAMP